MLAFGFEYPMSGRRCVLFADDQGWIAVTSWKRESY